MNDLFDLVKFADDEVCAEGSIALAESDSNVCLFDGHEIVGSIADHAHLTPATAEQFIFCAFLRVFRLQGLLHFFDDSSFVLRRHSCEHFDFV